jgi:hypothetical protein
MVTVPVDFADVEGVAQGLDQVPAVGDADQIRLDSQRDPQPGCGHPQMQVVAAPDHDAVPVGRAIDLDTAGAGRCGGGVHRRLHEIIAMSGPRTPTPSWAFCSNASAACCTVIRER